MAITPNAVHHQHQTRLRKGNKKESFLNNVPQCGYCSREAEDDANHKMCNSCMMVQYCSKECQRAHWKSNHKKLCIPLKERRVSSQQINCDMMGGIKNMVTEPCAICLEQVSSESDCVLKCDHIFHVKCLSHLRSSNDAIVHACPLCRTDLPPGPEESYCKGFLFFLQNRQWVRDSSDSVIPTPSQKQDVEQAIELLSSAANEGHVKASDLVCDMLLNGNQCIRDEKRAAILFRKAAQQGDAATQFDFGNLLFNGRGVKKNEKEAGVWCRKAAEQGYAAAQLSLGRMLFNGRGMETNEKEGVIWWFKAAKQGNVDAQLLLGTHLYNGSGVKKDLKKAAIWWERAAEQGNVDAQCNLGRYLLEEAPGVAENERKAAIWWRKAAEQGNGNAQAVLGQHLFDGIGVEQNDKEAVFWWREAAKQGNAIAKDCLRKNVDKV